MDLWAEGKLQNFFEIHILYQPDENKRLQEVAQPFLEFLKENDEEVEEEA